MNTNHIYISFIILNWNTKELLKQCLESIETHITSIAYEIIVVDNNSTDGSAKMVTDNFKNVILIRNNANVGFSKGNNIGAKIAKGEYLVFLNSDILFTKETDIDYFISKFQEDTNLGITAPQLLNVNGSIQKSVRNFPYPLGVFFHYTGLSKLFGQNKFFNKYLNLHWNHNQECHVEQPAGAFLMIPSKLFTEIGGFNEHFFIYYDDVDLCKKIILKKKNILFSPKVKAIHLGGESAKLVLGGLFFERNKNLITFYRTYYSKSHVLSLKFALFFALLPISIIWALQVLIRKKNKNLVAEVFKFLWYLYRI